MNYCSSCGGTTEYKIPKDDNRFRYVCSSCGNVHYQNPKVVCGCLVRSGDKVLLCRRGIQPRLGLWTFPAGFLEQGESTSAGAARETLEEANAEVSVDSLYIQFDLVYLSQIYLFFLATLTGTFSAGHETLDAQLFSKSSIPRDDLAFAVVRHTLQLYFNDREIGNFPHRHVVIPTREHWDQYKSDW